jgi:hypothetical protein
VETEITLSPENSIYVFDEFSSARSLFYLSRIIKNSPLVVSRYSSEGKLESEAQMASLPRKLSSISYRNAVLAHWQQRIENVEEKVNFTLKEFFIQFHALVNRVAVNERQVESHACAIDYFLYENRMLFGAATYVYSPVNLVGYKFFLLTFTSSLSTYKYFVISSTHHIER